MQLTFGEDFDCALRGDGVAHCWGNHRFGQFKVSAGIHFTEIAAGNYHVCGLTTESQVVCWGGEAEAFKRIGFLDIPSDVQFTKLGALRYQTCGRTVGGEIICWGRGRFSEEHCPSPLDDKLYSYNIPDAIITQLASFSLSDIELGEFSARELEHTAVPEASIGVTTMEAASAIEGSMIVIAPDDADADPGNSHQVAIADGTEIEITVTSKDTSRTRQYRVVVVTANRAPVAAEILPLKLTTGDESARLTLAEFALQVRAEDETWGERILPRARYLPADADLDRCLFSSPLSTRQP